MSVSPLEGTLVGFPAGLSTISFSRTSFTKLNPLTLSTQYEMLASQLISLERTALGAVDGFFRFGKSNGGGARGLKGTLSFVRSFTLDLEFSAVIAGMCTKEGK